MSPVPVTPTAARQCHGALSPSWCLGIFKAQEPQIPSLWSLNKLNIVWVNP